MPAFIAEGQQPTPEGRAVVRVALRAGERHVGPYWAVFRDGVLVRFETAGGLLVHAVGDPSRDVDDVIKPEGYECPLDLILGKE